MALPKLKNAQVRDIAAAESQELRHQADILRRTAEQLKIENETDKAKEAIAQAAEMENKAAEKAEIAKKLHERAAVSATIGATVKTPLNAAGTYIKAHFDTFLQKSNPLNQLQGTMAALTPFTGAFEREKARLLGGGGSQSEGLLPFGKVATAIEQSNIILGSISRSQVKLVDLEKDTIKRVELSESATREVGQMTINKLEEIKSIIEPGAAPGEDGDEVFSDFTPPPEAMQRPFSIYTTGGDNNPMRPETNLGDPRSFAEQMESQTDILLKILDIQTEQLDETKKSEQTRRLEEAEKRGAANKDGLDRGAEPSQKREEREGGGMLSRILGGLSGLFGGFATRIMSVIGPIVGTVGRLVGGLGRFLGIGGRAAGAIGAVGAAGMAAGAVQDAAAASAPGAAAAARGGAGAVRAAGGGLARRVLGFLPGIGSAMSVMDAVAAAREGNWGGAALHGVAAAAGLIPIPGLGPLARVGIQTVAGSLGHMTNTAEAPTITDRRNQRLDQANPQERDRQSPATQNIVTNHNYHNYGGQGNDRTVIARTGKTITEWSKTELFAYTT